MIPKNSLSWVKTRPHYVRYMEAKKARNMALKEFNAARQAIIAVAKQYLTTTMTSSSKTSIDAIVTDFFVEEVDEVLEKTEIDIKHSVKMPVRFLKARARYAKAVKNLNETYEAADAAEAAYNKAVFQTLNRDHTFTAKFISDVFGIWIPSLRKQMSASESENDDNKELI